jgi:Porin subfamily
MRYRFAIRSAAAIATAAMLAARAGETLINPRSPPAPPRPPLAAKPSEKERMKLCSAYGAGFVNIPGTGACIKIGVSVTVDSSIGRSR